MSDLAHSGPIAAPTTTARVTATDAGLLAVRLVLGVVFLIHGSQKVFGWFGGPGLSHTVGMFTQMMHIPVVFAWLAIIAEFFGGLALVFGVLTRLAALGIGVNMLVAIALVHGKNGFFMNWQGNQPGEGYEYHLLVLAMVALLILAGPGRIALWDPERKWLGIHSEPVV